MKETLLHRIKDGLRDMCYIWAKEMRQTITDEGVLIFFLLVPFLYPLLYSWAYSGEMVREVPVAIVDNSHSHQSRQFIREFDASPNTRVAYYCQNLDEARALVGKQVVHGVLYFPSDFQTRTLRMEQSHVAVYCDMSLMLTYKAIFQTAQAVASDMNTKMQIALSGNFTDREDEIQTKPLDFEEVPIFNPTGGYGSFLIPCVLILIIQQTMLLGIGLAAGTARESNRYQDLVPVSRHYNGIFRIVLGKSLAYFMIFSVVTAYLTIIVPRLFGFTSLLSGAPLLALMVPYILACIFFGMMLSCLVRYRENVILLVVFTSIPVPFRHLLAAKQHARCVAQHCHPASFNVRSERLRAPEHDGCYPLRCASRVSGIVAADARLLPCHVCRLSFPDHLCPQACQRSHSDSERQGSRSTHAQATKPNIKF